MYVAFAEGQFNGMGDGNGVGCVYSPEKNGCFKFKTVGKVTGFNLFYES